LPTFYDFPLPGILEARICTGIGLPVPEPPQLLQTIFPDPLHVLQPRSSSDHLVHMHGTLRDPLQVGHCLPPIIGFCFSSASKMDFTSHALATSEAPCTTWIIPPGPILQLVTPTRNSNQNWPSYSLGMVVPPCFTPIKHTSQRSCVPVSAQSFRRDLFPPQDSSKFASAVLKIDTSVRRNVTRSNCDALNYRQIDMID
jgi:hypothetical protein